MCGPKSCRQEEFYAFIRFTTVLQQSPAGHIVGFRNRNEKRFGLRELLELGWRQQCEDPRDKVFGLLGLAKYPPQRVEPIVADYRKSVLEVFEDVVRFLYKENGAPAEGDGIEARARERFLLRLAVKMRILPSSVRGSSLVSSYLGEIPPVVCSRWPHLWTSSKPLRGSDINVLEHIYLHENN